MEGKAESRVLQSPGSRRRGLHSGDCKTQPLRVILIGAIVVGFIAYICFLWPGAAPSWACNPGGIEKKTVSLGKNFIESERAFLRECAKCHRLPDPARPNCAAGASVGDFGRITSYRENVRAGKGLYEENCGGCHKLISPEAHTFDFWSKNLCTSDDICIMKKKLNTAEEQQLLLYLSAHSQKQEP